jgi:starch-binding outer membrane protein, SusD/RagB family
MKKINIFLLLSFCLVQLSCKDDFLYTTDPTRINRDLFYQNQTQFDQALNGIYGQLQGITNTAYLGQEFYSDNTTVDINLADRGGAAGWEAFEFSTVNQGNGEINALWVNHYATMYNINFALEKLEKATFDATAKGAIEGQLKFLRAYHYFNLTRYFGDVVLATKTLSDPNEAFDLLRSPQAEVYKQIESDLNDAVKVLPATYTANQRGKVTKGAALTLLGKVYLTRKNYTAAVTALKEVTNLGYSLNADYKDNFDPAKKNGPESIFEVQYQGGNDLGEQSNFAYIFAPRLSGAAITGFANTTPQGRNIPTNDLIKAYEEGDLRKAVSLKTSYTSGANTVNIPYITKYTYPHTITGRTDNNWPILRYADALLMLAEATNEGGGTDEALTLLNRVRKRAGLADLTGLGKDALREAILKERRVELAFENHRFFDLQRTNTPSQLAALMNAHGAREKANPTVARPGLAFNELDYVYSDFEYLLPIPAPQILINAKLTQNEGYK